MKAHIYITLKSGVLDPQGKAIENALHHLGFSETQEVRQGKFIEVTLDAANAAEANDRAAAMCEKLLANTVIENYRIEIID